MEFKQAFKILLYSFTENASIASSLWAEIEKAYNKKNRHYHTLVHLDHLQEVLLPVQHLILDWPILIFSIAYHDIIYNALKNDNEEQSAQLAITRLTALNVGRERINKCSAQILATKKHINSTDEDANYFIDADLSILGSSPAVYKAYTIAIRKEYKIYPALIYKPGRQKVLKHFLDMPFIFKTNAFREKYETLARQNLQNELTELSTQGQ